jgi:hypothetical protein
VASVLGLLVSGGLLAPAPARGATASYVITANTAGLSGSSGYLDFQFNPISAPNTNEATITGFSTNGTLVGAPSNLGGASGSLPGTVNIVANTGFNDSLQQFTYGSTLTFDVTLTFTPNQANGTTFSFYFLDPNFKGYSTGPAGEALDITVFTASSFTIHGPGTNSPGSPNTPSLTVTVVPEPSSVVMMGLGIAAVAALGLSRTRRRAA